MIVIQTYRTNKATGSPEYKDYHATCGIAAEMAAIRNDDEWKIDDNGDTYTVYTHSWRDDEKRQEFADAVGCDPSDVILYAFDGYEYTPKYKEVS